jgi:hypothetical protein
LEEIQEGVILRCAAAQSEWVAHVLISLDFPISIIRPVELRESIRQLGMKALQIAGDAEGIVHG